MKVGRLWALQSQISGRYSTLQHFLQSCFHASLLQQEITPVIPTKWLGFEKYWLVLLKIVSITIPDQWEIFNSATLFAELLSCFTSTARNYSCYTNQMIRVWKILACTAENCRNLLLMVTMTIMLVYRSTAFHRQEMSSFPTDLIRSSGFPIKFSSASLTFQNQGFYSIVGR